MSKLDGEGELCKHRKALKYRVGSCTPFCGHLRDRHLRATKHLPWTESALYIEQVLTKYTYSHAQVVHPIAEII